MSVAICRHAFFAAEAGPATRQAMFRARARWQAMCSETLLCLIEGEGHAAGQTKHQAALDLHEARRLWAQWRLCATVLPKAVGIAHVMLLESIKPAAPRLVALGQAVTRLVDAYVEQHNENLELHVALVNTGARIWA